MSLSVRPNVGMDDIGAGNDGTGTAAVAEAGAAAATAAEAAAGAAAKPGRAGLLDLRLRRPPAVTHARRRRALQRGIGPKGVLRRRRPIATGTSASPIRQTLAAHAPCL